MNCLFGFLDSHFEETAPKWVQEIIVNCIREAGYSLKEALANPDIVDEIRTTISSSLHNLHLNVDKCVKMQIELWNGNYLLSSEEKYNRLIEGFEEGKYEYDAVDSPDKLDKIPDTLKVALEE
jgi:hypothetical protein